jgi:hypothetical protein
VSQPLLCSLRATVLAYLTTIVNYDRNFVALTTLFILSEIEDLPPGTQEQLYSELLVPRP